MVAFMARRKVLHVFLAWLMLAELVPLTATAADEKTSVENVHFEVAGELVRIFYDLNGPPERVHAVTLTLRRESDSLFVYRPVNLTEDVGTIVFPGQKRRIIWDFTKEFPEGLTGDDYYFVVEAEMAPTEGISPLIWVGGGVAVAGGVLTLILLSKSKPEPPKPTPDFPLPPGRPF